MRKFRQNSSLWTQFAAGAAMKGAAVAADIADDLVMEYAARMGPQDAEVRLWACIDKDGTPLGGAPFDAPTLEEAEAEVLSTLAPMTPAEQAKHPRQVLLGRLVCVVALTPDLEKKYKAFG